MPCFSVQQWQHNGCFQVSLMQPLIQCYSVRHISGQIINIISTIIFHACSVASLFFSSVPALLVHLGMQAGLMTGGAVWWFFVLLLVLFLPSFLARWCLDKGKIILCYETNWACQKRTTSYDTRSSLKDALWFRYVERMTPALNNCAKPAHWRVLPEQRRLTIICVLGFAVIHHLCFPVDTEQNVSIRHIKSLCKKAEIRGGDLPRWPVHYEINMWWSLQVYCWAAYRTVMLLLCYK